MEHWDAEAVAQACRRQGPDVSVSVHAKVTSPLNGTWERAGSSNEVFITCG